MRSLLRSELLLPVVPRDGFSCRRAKARRAVAGWADMRRTRRYRNLTEDNVRIVVDRDICEGNALCVGLAPTVFDLNDDDLLTVLEEEPDQATWPDVEAAVRSCPKQALRIVREP
jgi:ferredoxin